MLDGLYISYNQKKTIQEEQSITFWFKQFEGFSNDHFDVSKTSIQFKYNFTRLSNYYIGNFISVSYFGCYPDFSSENEATNFQRMPEIFGNHYDDQPYNLTDNRII